jgi:hypothetical protein
MHSSIKGAKRMEEIQQITSFVIRFNCVDLQKDTHKKQWRIKIRHVQGEEEISVKSFDDMLIYMKRVLGE